MRAIRGPLQLVILAPILGLMLLAGLVLYFTVLRTVGDYADRNIQNSLNSLLQNVLTIADSEVDRQNRESRITDADAALTYQLNARIRFEDFARDQGIGLLVVADEVLDFVTGLSTDDAKLIFDSGQRPAISQIHSQTGTNYYVTSAGFSPWKWRVFVVKEGTEFDALVYHVKLIYGYSALALLAISCLLIFWLRQLMVRPIFQIASEFSDGKAPTYQGVRELEHLSNSIGSMLTSLRAKTLHLETTLQSMSDAIAVFDTNMRIVAWNSKYVQLYRYPDRLIQQGTSFEEIMRYNVDRGDYGPGDPEAQITEIVDRAKTLSPPRFEVDRADGTSVEVRRAAMPDGGFVTTYTDITDRRKSARFAAANVAKSRFLENMSHDLRKPIAAVIEDCQLLLSRKSGLGSPERSVIENVGGNTRHLLGMVDELLEMSRIEAGQIDVKPSQINVATIIAQAWRAIEPVARAKHLTFTSDVKEEIEVWTDGKLLTRILMNLLANAVEYTSRGSVQVAARLRGSKLAILVSDTGCGIPTDKLELVFEKFQRIEPTAGMTRAGTGLGLGLAISREFSHLLQGRISVTSEVGRGSVFTLTVPSKFGGVKQ